MDMYKINIINMSMECLHISRLLSYRCSHYQVKHFFKCTYNCILASQTFKLLRFLGENIGYLPAWSTFPLTWNVEISYKVGHMKGTTVPMVFNNIETRLIL